MEQDSPRGLESVATEGQSAVDMCSETSFVATIERVTAILSSDVIPRLTVVEEAHGSEGMQKAALLVGSGMILMLLSMVIVHEGLFLHR